MSIVAFPAPMAAVSKYLWGAKACKEFDRRQSLKMLKRHLFGISEIYLFELLNQQDEVLLVLGRTSSLGRVLPVKVKAWMEIGNKRLYRRILSEQIVSQLTVKVVLLQEVDGAVDKLLPLLLVLGHPTVLRAPLVPTTDGNHHLRR